VLLILAYRREQLARPLDAFGFVVPEIENRKILAASFSSVKYEGRAPDDRVLIRVFIGGACHGELLERSDDELQSIAHSELTGILQIKGSPVLTRVARWTGSMPQYHVGHLQLVANIEQAAARWPTLQLAGNAYRGVGIPYCIHSGEQAAERIVEVLASHSHSGVSNASPS
jgi:protoporphyrinogen/coproporphyrinogen III oxidase